MYNYPQRLAEMQELGLIRILVCDTHGELPMDLRNSGLLGTYSYKTVVKFELVLEVNKSADVAVFFTQGDARDINFINDRSSDEEMTGFFSKNIGTTTDNDGRYTTKNNPHQTNGVWFMSFAKGKLKMWEVAIVTKIIGELSWYYLSLQLTYQADMFNKEGELWISPEQFPGYENWHSLQDLLQEAVDIKLLKPASKYKAAKVKKVKLADNQAKITWFSQSRRYGFAELGDGRTGRLHASQVLEQEFPAFEPGQIVLFDSLRATPQGTDLIGVKEI